MGYRKIVLWMAAAVCAAVLAGCGEAQSEQSGMGTAEVLGTETVDTLEDTAVGSLLDQSDHDMTEPSEGQPGDGVTEPPTDQPEDNAAETSESETEQVSPEQTSRSTPTLPAAGCELSDFVPEDWELMDSVELDYNGDGVTDYVGVLEVPDDEENWMDSTAFRILFAIVSEGTEQYRLDFQNESLIHTWDEGGPFGDPYERLTAEGNSFTVSAYGGSSWKWSEMYTYTYRGGTWYLTWSEEYSMFGRYTVDDVIDDWEKGVRTRKMRSTDFDMEKVWIMEEEEMEAAGYDLEYEMRLDEPPTLYQASKRWQSALDRVTDWEVHEIVLAEGVEVSQEMIIVPRRALLYNDDYHDENGVLYTFYCGGQDEQRKHYLAMYCWQDKSLNVLAEEDAPISDSIKAYGDKIYYSTACKSVDDDVVYRLNRINMDGTGKETVFETPYEDRNIKIMDISGGEIIVELCDPWEPNLVYRMDVDGGNPRQIGQIPKE